MSTTMTAILLCLFLYDTLGSHRAASQPVIVASPPEIDVGLSDTLDVNCTVSVAGWSSVAALISLTVSRNNSQTGWTELAIVSDFSSGQVNVMTTAENITTSGWFKPSGSASVSLHWDYPTDQQAGIYVCSAQGFDTFGHSLVSNTDVQVSAHSPGMSDVQDKLRQMDIRMKQSQSKTEALALEVLELKQERQSRILQMFEASFEYKNHTYYVSRDAFSEIFDCIAICRMYGGYMAEIDDSDEYHAINRFLLSTSGFYRAYISGTDHGHEGTWTLLSGEPLPFEEWAPDQPSHDDTRNCLMLYRIPQQIWAMYEFYCEWSHPERVSRFLCEVPRL